MFVEHVVLPHCSFFHAIEYVNTIIIYYLGDLNRFNGYPTSKVCSKVVTRNKNY